MSSTGDLAASGGIAAAVAASLVFLFRTWISEHIKSSISHEYEQKLETHKAQLKAHSDTEIERLKSQLSIAASEHQVQYAKLQEKRGDAIAEMHALLQDVYEALGQYVKPFVPVGDAPQDARKEKLVASLREFESCYAHLKVFLPKDTAERAGRIKHQLTSAGLDFQTATEIKAPSPAGHTADWFEIANRVKGPIAAELAELEDDFRRLLGDRGV